jgi:hypothetical protein
VVRGSVGYVLQTTVPASTTDFTTVVSRSLPDDGVVTRVVPWHTPNSQDAVEVRPFRRDPDEERLVGLVRYGDGEDYITGEPDREPIPASEPVFRDDGIELRARNLNGTVGYRVSYTIVVDHSVSPSANRAADRRERSESPLGELADAVDGVI